MTLQIVDTWKVLAHQGNETNKVRLTVNSHELETILATLRRSGYVHIEADLQRRPTNDLNSMTARLSRSGG